MGFAVNHFSRICFFLGFSVFVAGCATQMPVTPFSTLVYVPHPEKADSRQTIEELVELFSVSPERDPDGLGASFLLWRQSKMTLVPLILTQKREALRKIVYGQSPLEQKKAEEQNHLLHEKGWIFEGILISDHAKPADAKWYLPEGVYIQDDKGKIFRPLHIEADHPKNPYQIKLGPLPRSKAMERAGRPHVGTPLLVFPRGALTADTRAISLYFAAFNKRARFTWVFDQHYTLPESPLGDPAKSGPRRMWGTR